MRNKGFIALFSLVALAGCGQSSPVVLYESQFGQTTYEETSLSSIRLKLDNKDNFVVYLYSSSCGACIDFSELLSHYIQETGALIYGIDIATITLNQDNDYLPYRVTPTIFIFKNGETILKADLYDHNDAFIRYEELKKMMNQYLVLSPMKKIKDVESLREIIKKDSFVYYYYPLCGDCTFFDCYYLNDALAKIQGKNLYSFDMTKYFQSRESEPELWDEFVLEFGLAKKSSPYGYKNGVVPMMLHYQNEVIKGGCVIFNDELEVIKNDVGEIEQVKIIDSYYENNPFMNKTFKSTAKKDAKSIYREELLSFYQQQFENFIKDLQK